MARTRVLPRKWIETSRPPRADWLAERAAGVAAKVPTAKPPTAPTAAPIRNLVVPSPNRKNSFKRPSHDGASLAQRPGVALRQNPASYTGRRMLETGKKR